MTPLEKTLKALIPNVVGEYTKDFSPTKKEQVKEALARFEISGDYPELLKAIESIRDT